MLKVQLDIRKLPHVGPKRGALLESKNVTDVRDVLRYSEQELVLLLDGRISTKMAKSITASANSIISNTKILKIPKEFIRRILKVLETLTPLEERVLQMRFGLTEDLLYSDVISERRLRSILTFIGQARLISVIDSYEPSPQLSYIIEKTDKLSPELIKYLKEHHDEIDKIPWEIFEHLVAEFLTSKGYDDVRLVGRDSSTSADIYASHVRDPLGIRLRFFVEVKREKDPVGIEVIHAVHGAVFLEKPKFGWHAAIIVSTGGFKRFRKYSKHEISFRGLELKDRNDLLRWLDDYKPNKNGLWLPTPLRQAPRNDELSI